MITGWVPNPQAVEEFCQSLADSGVKPRFGDSYPKLNGFWMGLVKRGATGVFLWEWEDDLLRKRTAVDMQAAGVDPGSCVSRATHRAAQDSHGMAIRRGRLVGKPVELCYETIYGGGRVKIGNGSLGWQGGMVGAWAARYVREVGVLPRGVYGSHDLTHSREDLAELWGRPRVGAPSELEAISHPVKAVHHVKTVDELADCTAAEFGSAMCSTWLFGDRNKKGMSTYAGPTAHCESIRGVFITMEGGLGFVRQQSWGPNSPQGPQKLQYAGGEIDLPPGCYGVYGEDLQQAMNTGETWAIGFAETLRSTSESEFTKGLAA